MKKDNQENTLLLGNGFSQTVFKEIPSWDGLFKGTDLSIDNYTIRYEAYRLLKGNAHAEEAVVKKRLIEKINVPFSEKNLNNGVCDLDDFGMYLCKSNINNIITTNYDTGIEFILNKCGYEEQKVIGVTPEKVYNIRTYKLYTNGKSLHSVKLWKIHGDIDRIASITLGFDQYCGSLAKLTDYVKGKYSSSQNSKSIRCKTHMKDKCNNNNFDSLSWAELFFRTNVFIVGFGMNFSEIDIWWLINKRARFKNNGVMINNTITYLYNPIYEDREKKPAIFSALDAFNVICQPIKPNEPYFKEIFEKIQNLN